MIVKTKAIILTSIKYGETDLIVKSFTEEGAKTYILKRILKSKSNKINIAYFQPLSQLQLLANHNNKGNLNSIKEARLSYVYQSLSTNILKQSVAFFLAEVLSYSLHEEEKNTSLFKYIETSLIWLDRNNNTANFHLIFLLNLTKHLGFYPDMKNRTSNYFDFEEGVFTNQKPLNNYIEGQKLILFKSLIGINFDDYQRLQINSRIRKNLIDILLNYYTVHIPGFRIPKSLNVLKEVFNS